MISLGIDWDHYIHFASDALRSDWKYWLGIAVSVCGWARQTVRTRREQRAKEVAENELRLVKRRGEAPFYVLCGDGFGPLMTSYNTMLPPGHEAVLSCFRDRVDPENPEITEVGAVLYNTGKAVKAQVVKLDGEPASIRVVTSIDRTREFHLLEYPFHRDRFGKRSVLEVKFETVEGPWGTHIYETTHGCFTLKRIDPPLPS